MPILQCYVVEIIQVNFLPVQLYCLLAELHNLYFQFNQLLFEHETLVSRYLNREPLQKSQFRDFGGQIKSLGAWGGDFMLVSGNPETPSYFKSKGYTTIFKFTEILKN